MGIYIQSDKYFNNKAKFSEWGDVCPVDFNGGLVVEKCGKQGMCKEDGERTQMNIRERFGFQTD